MNAQPAGASQAGAPATRPHGSSATASDLEPVKGARDCTISLGRLFGAMQALTERGNIAAQRVAIRFGKRTMQVVMPGGNSKPASQMNVNNDKTWNVGDGTATRQIGEGPSYAASDVITWITAITSAKGVDSPTATDTVDVSRGADNALTVGEHVLRLPAA